MKFKFIKIGLLITGLILTAATTNAQYTFDVPASGAVNVPGVGAAGTVDFDLTEKSVEVSIYNTTNDSIFAESYITGFYILKPWADESDIDFELAGIPAGLTWVESDEEKGNDPYNGLPFIPNQDKYDFFGAGVTAGHTEDNGLSMNEYYDDSTKAVFSFDLTGTVTDIDLSIYAYDALNPELPHIIIRWQAIDVVEGGAPIGDGEEAWIKGGSAKGYGFFPEDPGGIIVPVPEPSQIALMALLGMGGVLWIRKRIRRKSA